MSVPPKSIRFLYFGLPGMEITIKTFRPCWTNSNYIFGKVYHSALSKRYVHPQVNHRNHARTPPTSHFLLKISRPGKSGHLSERLIDFSRTTEDLSISWEAVTCVSGHEDRERTKNKVPGSTPDTTAYKVDVEVSTDSRGQPTEERSRDLGPDERPCGVEVEGNFWRRRWV